MGLVDAEERKAASGNDGPRRLLEAFSRFSAKARFQAARVRELESDEHRLEKTERSKLQERNQNLERQIKEIQSSRSWRMLSKLGRMRAGMSGKKG